MSILDSTYDVVLDFPDMFDVIEVEWNVAYFNVAKMNETQYDSKLTRGTFEDILPDIIEVHNRKYDNIIYQKLLGSMLFKSMQQYLDKHNPDLHTYKYYTNDYSFGGIGGPHAIAFEVWAAAQREMVYLLKFKFKHYLY